MPTIYVALASSRFLSAFSGASHQAVQCGYCISGIAMRVKALFDSDPNVSEATLDAALDQHLCRCGTHVRIKQALRELLIKKG